MAMAKVIHPEGPEAWIKGTSLGLPNYCCCCWHSWAVRSNMHDT